MTVKSFSKHRPYALLAMTAAVIFVTGFVSVFSRTASDAKAPDTPTTEELSPTLRLVRTLTAPNEHYPLLNMVSGTSNLTWSPDGERLAAYVRNGDAIMVWSPDGKIAHEIPRLNHTSQLAGFVLGFLSGHKQLITEPAAEDDAHAFNLDDIAFSVVDAETGHVVRSIAGDNPGKSFRENIVSKLVISPDQRFVAVVYNVLFGESVDWRVGVYETNDWRRVALLSFGVAGESRGADAIAFSPDAKTLAIAYTTKTGINGCVDIFDVGPWSRLQTITAFPDKPPPMHPLTIVHVSFSGDSSMIVVGSGSGGSWWKNKNGTLAAPGSGIFLSEFPGDSLRVFKVDDGGRVASTAGKFPGGFLTSDIISWSSSKDAIAFMDPMRDLRLWNPFSAGAPPIIRHIERTTTTVSFSPDGKLLSQGFGDGIRLFEIVEHQK